MSQTGPLLPDDGRHKNLLGRVIEFLVLVLVAFLILVAVSFVSLRPTLQELRSEAKLQWDAYVHEVKTRNAVLPRLAEGLRSFDLSLETRAKKLHDARVVAQRVREPDDLIAAADEIDTELDAVADRAAGKPAMMDHAPFAEAWREVVTITRRVRMRRLLYSSRARCYNMLLNSFPQNLVATVFGYVPLDPYAPRFSDASFGE